MDSNIGESGPQSIRIDGRRISNLPLGQGNEAREGLAEFLKTYKQTKRNNVIAKFPKHRMDVLKAQVKECRGNIKRIKDFKQNLKNQIFEYRQHIKNVELRSKLLDEVDPNDKAAAKKIRLEYPPYDVDALNQQIIQFEEAIERCDDVIEQDYDSITKIEKIIGLVEQKDRELSSIG